MRIYLCSRTKAEYHAQNETVAQALEALEFLDVFVPHRVDLENPAHKNNPFPRDYEEMRRADLCVAVGPFGPDCAAEIGWFAGRGVPVFCIYQDTTQLCDFAADQPMVAGFVDEFYSMDGLNNLTDAIDLYHGDGYEE